MGENQPPGPCFEGVVKTLFGAQNIALSFGHIAYKSVRKVDASQDDLLKMP